MTAIEIIMCRRKSTDYKVLFKDNLDRIGSVYLTNPTINKMGITDEITMQLAPDKSFLKPGGYITKFHRHKETQKKVRFNEDTREQGALGVIYVSKKILEQMGCDCEEIAVRLEAYETAAGGEAIAQKGR